MDELKNQINSVMQVTKSIAESVVKDNNFSLIPELMNLLEVVIPNIFLVNNNVEIFNNEDIINILDEIVDAYDNKDAVFMEDVLIYGLYGFLNNFLKELK